MDFVTGRTAFDAGGFVLIKERPALVGMARETLFLFEPAEQISCSRLVGIVAGRASHDPFLKPVPLVELELGKNIFMATSTDFILLSLEQGRNGLLAMDAMARRTVKRGSAMRTNHELGIVFRVTGETFSGFLADGIRGREGEYPGLASFINVLFPAAMAGCAALSL
jgi:hypothetical protein